MPIQISHELYQDFLACLKCWSPQQLHTVLKGLIDPASLEALRTPAQSAPAEYYDEAAGLILRSALVQDILERLVSERANARSTVLRLASEAGIALRIPSRERVIRVSGPPLRRNIAEVVLAATFGLVSGFAGARIVETQDPTQVTTVDPPSPEDRCPVELERCRATVEENNAERSAMKLREEGARISIVQWQRVYDTTRKDAEHWQRTALEAKSELARLEVKGSHAPKTPTPRWTPCRKGREARNVVSIKCALQAGEKVVVKTDITLGVARDGQAEVVLQECRGDGNECGRQLNSQMVHGTKGPKPHNADSEEYVPSWIDVDFVLSVSDTTPFTIASACFTVSQSGRNQLLCIRRS